LSSDLKDPNKPADAIVTVNDDGSAVRNDGLELAAANRNPWYVLATIYGEQGDYGISSVKANKNRRVWNGWFSEKLGEKRRSKVAEFANISVEELMPLSHEERSHVEQVFEERTGHKELPFPSDHANFINTYFDKEVHFVGFVFIGSAEFNGAQFNRRADFSHAFFGGSASFSSTRFKQQAVFNAATFNSSANFNSCSFRSEANFSNARFMSFSAFDSAKFNSMAFFVATVFNSAGRLHDGTSFAYSCFNNRSEFPLASFYGTADFSSAKFKAQTIFDDVEFKTAVPQFHAAELYDDTTFTLPDDYTQNWPPLRGPVAIDVAGETEMRDVMPAKDQKRAYNRLRLFMNKTLQIEEEQFFHRQEMRCKAVNEKWYYRGFFWLYENIADYGNSFLQPAYLLFCLWIFGVISKLGKMAAGGWWPDIGTIPNAMGWSFANLFPFFGFRRLYFPKQETLHWLLQIIGGSQTVMGFILLFLLGLGLRNRFRLR